MFFLKNNIYIRIFLILLCFLSFEFPINSILKIIPLFLIILIIIFANIKDYINFKYFLTIIISLFVLKLFIPILKIQEGHNVLVLNANSQDFYENNLPKKVYEIVENLFNKYYNKSSCSAANGFCWKSFDPDRNFDESSFEATKFAKSSHWSLYDVKYSRIINNINFTNLKTARIETINNIDFNFVFPKTYDLSRETIPYFSMIEISEQMIGGSLCWKGHTFWEDKNKNFIHEYNLTYDCKIIINEHVNKFFYAIDFGSTVSKIRLNELYGDQFINLDEKELANFLEENKLILKFEKNKTLKLFETLRFIITLTIIFLILLFFFKKEIKNYKIYLLSLIYTFLFFILSYLVHEDLIQGFTVYTGGNDGIVYSTFANKMFFELKNLNFFEFFRGSENIFYFMPGIRYFFSTSKIIFGESIYGYLLISFLYPIVIYLLLKSLIGKKISILITFLFFISRIFEGYAFSTYSFLQHIKEGDSEPLAIFLFLFCLYLFINNIKNKFVINLPFYFLFGFLLFITVAVRPNYLPASLFLILSMSIYLLKSKKYLKQFLFIILGFSFLLFLPVHNYYYGDTLLFFTSGVSKLNYIPLSTWFNLFFDILSFNIINIKDNYGPLLSNLNRWIQPDEIHYIITFSIVTLILITKHKLYVKSISIMCILQHLVCIYLVPDGRYAYLAWILTFIINIYFLNYIYITYLKKN